MTTYARADEFYRNLRPVFDHIQADAPEALRGLLAARLAVRFRCSGPAASVLLNGRSKPAQVTYGDTASTRADLELTLATDTLHLLLMDALSIRKAMGAGLIRVKGPVWKLSVLIDIIKAGRRFYPQVVQQGALAR